MTLGLQLIAPLLFAALGTCRIFLDRKLFSFSSGDIWFGPADELLELQQFDCQCDVLLQVLLRVKIELRLILFMSLDIQPDRRTATTRTGQSDHDP